VAEDVEVEEQHAEQQVHQMVEQVVVEKEDVQEQSTYNIKKLVM
jgi:hypothetical protein